MRWYSWQHSGAPLPAVSATSGWSMGACARAAADAAECWRRYAEELRHRKDSAEEEEDEELAENLDESSVRRCPLQTSSPPDLCTTSGLLLSAWLQGYSGHPCCLST